MSAAVVQESPRVGAARWDFAGRTVVVTEAGSPRGLAQVRAFAAAGARVFACDPSRAVDPGVATGSVDPVVFDPTEEAAVAALAARVGAEAGGLNVLVVNHPGDEDRSLLDFPDQEWAESMRATLSSAFLFAKHLPGLMVAARYGKVVFTTGPESAAVGPGRGHLGTARHALAGLARVLAIESAPFEVNVNVVGAEVGADSPAGGQAARALTHTVLWLASDAARFVTGSIFTAGHGAASPRHSRTTTDRNGEQ